MSFFRFRSRIVNQQRQPFTVNFGKPLQVQTSLAEPALVFDSPTRQAAIQELPIGPAFKRQAIEPAARFRTLRRVMSRNILKRGKA